jgi:hypothetical protein
MKTITIKQAIEQHLINTMTAINKKLAETIERKAKKARFTHEEIAGIEEVIRTVGWSSQMENLLTLFSLLSHSPELKSGSMIPIEQFCIIKLSKNKSNHKYPVNTPLILTDKTNCFCLNRDGTMTTSRFVSQDEPVLASEEEIISCIKNLTQKQWSSIMTDGCFSDMIKAAMGSIICIESGVKDNEETEIILDNGRTITIGD